MEKQEQKKKWKKPELTILIRSNLNVPILLLETEFVISLFTCEPSMIVWVILNFGSMGVK